MNSVIKIVSENLKLFRKNKKYTQKDIADYLGTSQQAYSLYEKGDREINLESLQKLADYYNVSPSRFFIEENNIRIGEFSLTYSYLDAIFYSLQRLNEIMNAIDKYNTPDNEHFKGSVYEDLLLKLELKQKEYNDYIAKLKILIDSNKINEEVDKYFK